MYLFIYQIELDELSWELPRFADASKYLKEEEILESFESMTICRTVSH